MENKKIKLTISGKPKKLQKNFEISTSSKNKPVSTGKSHNKIVKKIDFIPRTGSGKTMRYKLMQNYEEKSI